MTQAEKLAQRSKSVVKANELIQKSRFSLSLQQQKMVLYLISKIEPQDEDFKLYEFSIAEFCKVCGIDYQSGRNYELLKEQIKALRDKSLWVMLDNGEETTLSWIEKPYISKKNGIIKVRLDKDMKPYLLQLKKQFTSYELIWTLRFDSKYSTRLYELIKSIHYHENQPYTRSYSLDELRKVLGAENYTVYQDFKKRALLPAIEEVNKYSDKHIEYSVIKNGRSVVGVEFTITTKPPVERINTRAMIEQELDKSQKPE